MDEDDQPDEWDQRIMDTGCHEENLKLQLCHADTGDWRKCTEEMKAFQRCWAANKNNERTKTVDNEDLWSQLRITREPGLSYPKETSCKYE